MYAISDGYKEVIYSGDAKHRLKILFNGTNIETIIGVEADRVCEKLTVKPRIIPNGSKSFTLDNFISKEAELILHKVDIEDIVEPIEISLGTLVNNNYEYVPIGVFNISDKPTTDKDKTTIKLYDNAIKFDFNYNGKDLIEEKQAGGSDGATRLEVLQDICTQAGVTTNISSFLGSSEIVATWDSTITGRVYISYLAEQAGAIPTIDRSGNLIFVYLNDLTTTRIPLSIVEKYTLGKPFQIGRVVYEDGVRKFEYPPEGTLYTGDILFINVSNPYIKSQSQIESIYDIVSTFTIDSLNTGKILGNPAIDPYDLIEIYDDYDEEEPTIATSLATYTMTYNGVIINTYDTQIGEEQRTENMSLKRSDEVFKRYVRSEIDEVEGTINLLAGEVHGEDGTGGLVGDTNELRLDMYGTTGKVENIRGDLANLSLTVEGLELQTQKRGDNILMGTAFYDLSHWGSKGVYYYEADDPSKVPQGMTYWYCTKSSGSYISGVIYENVNNNWVATTLMRKDLEAERRNYGVEIIKSAFTMNNFISQRAINITPTEPFSDGQTTTYTGGTDSDNCLIDRTQGLLTLSCKYENHLVNGSISIHVHQMVGDYESIVPENRITTWFETSEQNDLKKLKFTFPIFSNSSKVTGYMGSTEPESGYWLETTYGTPYTLKYKQGDQWVQVNDKIFVDNDTCYAPSGLFTDGTDLWSGYVASPSTNFDMNYIRFEVYAHLNSGETVPNGSLLIGDIKLEYGNSATEWTTNYNEVYGSNFKVDDRGVEVKKADYTLHLDEDEITGYYNNEIQFQLTAFHTYSKVGKFKETNQDGLITRKLSNGMYIRYIE